MAWNGRGLKQDLSPMSSGFCFFEKFLVRADSITRTEIKIQTWDKKFWNLLMPLPPDYWIQCPGNGSLDSEWLGLAKSHIFSKKKIITQNVTIQRWVAHKIFGRFLLNSRRSIHWFQIQNPDRANNVSRQYLWSGSRHSQYSCKFGILVKKYTMGY